MTSAPVSAGSKSLRSTGYLPSKKSRNQTMEFNASVATTGSEVVFTIAVSVGWGLIAPTRPRNSAARIRTVWLSSFNSGRTSGASDSASSPNAVQTMDAQ